MGIVSEGKKYEGYIHGVRVYVFPVVYFAGTGTEELFRKLSVSVNFYGCAMVA